MRIVMMAIGDELLRGETREGNGQALAAQLQKRHLQLQEVRLVGDDLAQIAATIASVRAQPTWLIVSGGLGPTDDDFTRQALATSLGLGLGRDQACVAAITERFNRLGRKMDPCNLRQADLPQGAEAVTNDHGTAPGFFLQDKQLVITCLPGVPREFRAMLDDHLDAWLDRLHLASAPRKETTFRLVGLPESTMQGLLSLLPHYACAKMRSLPTWPQIRLELSALTSDADFAALCAEVRQALGPYIFSQDREESFAAAVLRALRAIDATLAVAESCSGGLIGHLLTEVPRASHTLLLDAVTYANSAKIQLLSVQPELLASHGAVSEPVALAMARGAKDLAQSRVAIATSGVAGPDGGSAEKPVGTVCIALVSDGHERVETLHFKGLTRDRFKVLVAYTALDWLRQWARSVVP